MTPHGGKREGAGRPLTYGEPLQVTTVRLTQAQIDYLQALDADLSASVRKIVDSAMRQGEKNSQALESAVQRFWLKVDKHGPNECWEWRGARARGGYGAFSPGGGKSTVKAHVFSYELHHGPLPAGKIARHTCNNSACVNPAHLIPGTEKENIQDIPANKAEKRGRKSPGENAAHVFTPEDLTHLPGNPTVKDISKLKDVDESLVRRWCQDGKIPAHKAGRDWLIDMNALRKMVLHS